MKFPLLYRQWHWRWLYLGLTADLADPLQFRFSLVTCFRHNEYMFEFMFFGLGIDIFNASED